jgi:hypothetical protein
MSTPTSTLNGNTNTTDNNDINDPLVQDVLNEFRDEYTSKNKNTSSSSMIPDYEDEIVEFPPEDNYPPPPPSQYRKHDYNVSEKYPPSQNYKNSNIVNIDMELVKKNLTIVIIVLLIHNTSVVSAIYEKMPEYLHENLNAYDILIKTASLFIILYVLSFFNYI